VNSELLSRHAVVAVDTSILIYHFEAHPGYIAHTTQILKVIQSGVCRGVVSDISLLECLSCRLDRNWLDGAE